MSADVVDLVGGRYRVGALIGSGGTAAVYEAIDTSTGHSLAVKLLRPELAEQPARWDAFFEEVRAAQSIRHPGVVAIYDHGVDGGDPPVVWIAMERVNGVTLRDAVRTSGALDAATGLVVAAALLDVVAAAHDHNVVHRDITPANVMFDPTRETDSALAASVRLLDFGLADIPGRSTAGGDVLLSQAGSSAAGVIASVPFASPEHLLGAPVTEASDVYQLAATLFFAFAGRAPFAGDVEEQRRAHLAGRAPDLATIAPHLPRGLARWLIRAMMRDASERYPDAAAMRLALTEPVGRAFVVGDPSLTGHLEEISGEERTRVLPLAPDPTGGYGSTDPGQTAPASVSSRPAQAGRRGGGWMVAGVGALALTGIIAFAAMAQPERAPESSPAPEAVRSSAPSAEPSASTTTSSVVLVEVPEVGGISRVEAEGMLRGAGFTVGPAITENAPAARDTVLRSAPAAGTRLAMGAPVTLTVATGDSVVPPVEGLAPEEALAALRNAGFEADAPPSPTGRAVGTSPAAGAVLPLGTRVTVIFPAPSSPTPAPPPATQAPTTTPTPAPTSSPDPTEDPT